MAIKNYEIKINGQTVSVTPKDEEKIIGNQRLESARLRALGITKGTGLDGRPHSIETVLRQLRSEYSDLIFSVVEKA